MMLKGMMRGSGDSVQVIFVICITLFVATSRAGTIKKADNFDALNLPSSWVGGVAPTVADIALWDSTVKGANAGLLGANQTWGGNLHCQSRRSGFHWRREYAHPRRRWRRHERGYAESHDQLERHAPRRNCLQIWSVAPGRQLTLDTGMFTRSPGAASVHPEQRRHDHDHQFREREQHRRAVGDRSIERLGVGG